MNWFSEHRQAWIAETLRIFEFINRDHLVRKFGISIVQASNDMREFQQNNPGVVEYDKSAKRYVLQKNGSVDG